MFEVDFTGVGSELKISDRFREVKSTKNLEISEDFPMGALGKP